MRKELEHHFSSYHTSRHIRVEACQPTSDILGCIKHRLRHIPFSYPAAAFEMPEGCDVDSKEGFEGTVGGLEEPTRVSKWSRYCPVALYTDDTVTPGKAEFAVKFMGRLFLLSSEEARALFVNNPRKYLKTDPRPKERRVVVLGPPMSGKSEISKKLTEVYGWPILSVAELVSNTIDNFQEGQDKAILEEVRHGGALSSATIAKMVKEKMGTSWVLDGFPVDAAHAAMLLDDASKAHMVVVLQDDSGGEDLTARNNAALEGDGGYSSLDAASAKFTESLEAFTAALTEAGTPPEPAEGEEPAPNRAPPVVNVSCNGTLDMVVARVRRAVDPFLYEAAASDAGEAGAATSTDAEEPGDATLWGDTGTLCPVSLRAGKLRHGLDDFVAKYRGHYYKCASEEAMASFMAGPEQFTGEDFAATMPAPRVLVMGPPASGKKTLVSSLSKTYDVPVMSLEEIVNIFDHGTVAVDNNTIISEIQSRLDREPYKSKGCILCGLPYLKVDKIQNEEGEWEEGEPRDPLEQFTQLLEAELFMDAVVILSLSEDAATTRLLVPATEAELEAKRVEGMEDPAEDDEKTEEEIDAAIEELRAADLEERTAAITEANQAAMDTIDAAVAVFEEKAIPLIRLDASPRASKVIRAVEKSLHSYLKDRSLLLNQAILCPGGIEGAETALQQHNRMLTHFGRACPVCTESAKPVRTSEYAPPVVYRHHVYYPRTAAEAKELLASPRHFASLLPDQLVTAPCSFVVGPLRSGRTAVAKKVAKDLRATYVNMQDVLARVLEGSSVLRDLIEPRLRAGDVVPDDLCVRALVRALGSFACVRDGWVVDGFPTSLAQVRMLESAGIIPQCVFVTAPVPLGKEASQGRDPAQAAQVFKEAVSEGTAAFAAELEGIERFYSTMHGCCVRLPAEGSQWQRGAAAAADVWNAAQRQTQWKNAQRDDQAVRAHGLGITPVQQQLRIGKFMDFCPVTFKENESLAKCAPGLGLSVEYRGQLYKALTAEKLERLVANPAKYLDGMSLMAPPVGGRHPFPIPPTSGESSAQDLALEGHCPVTLWLNPTDRRCVIPGSINFQVQYGDLIFRMANKTAWQAFMERPWVYSDLVLPAKMPAGRAVVPLDELPARGYCEQTLARSVTAALNALCEQRPKYPGLSVQDSVLKFLSLYLRSHNKNENEEHHEVSQKLFDEFSDCCELAHFLDTQPMDSDDYKDKQTKFETVHSKPWEGLDLKSIARK